MYGLILIILFSIAFYVVPGFGRVLGEYLDSNPGIPLWQCWLVWNIPLFLLSIFFINIFQGRRADSNKLFSSRSSLRRGLSLFFFIQAASFFHGSMCLRPDGSIAKGFAWRTDPSVLFADFFQSSLNLSGLTLYHAATAGGITVFALISFLLVLPDLAPKIPGYRIQKLGLMPKGYTMWDALQASIGVIPIVFPTSMYRAANPYYFVGVQILLGLFVMVVIFWSCYYGVSKVKNGRIHFYWAVALSFLWSAIFSVGYSIMRVEELTSLGFLTNGLFMGMFTLSVPVALAFDMRNIISLTLSRVTQKAKV